MTPPLHSVDSPLLPPWASVRPFSAELWLIVAIAAVLAIPFFVRRRTAEACAGTAAAGLGAALLSTVATLGRTPSTLNGLLSADAVAAGWKGVLFAFVAGVIALQWARSKQSVLTQDAPEFYTLLLGSTLGMSLMASASNWLTLFLSVELTSLASYLLAGFHKTHRPGAEASLKYVLFGASVTAVMAYGLSLLYGLTGTLEMVPLPTDGQTLATLASFALIAGLSFKIAAVPFHFWCPDVFEGAEIEVTTFLSVASKGAALILLMRAMLAIDATSVRVLVGALAAVTMTVGNTAAFAQTSMKRMLAYSSIAQAGYMLATLSVLGGSGGAAPKGAGPAVLLYLAVYAVMNLGAFAVVAAVSDSVGGVDAIGSFRGLSRRSPLLALSMVGILVSLIGLPPLAGFGAKLSVLWVVAQGGGMGWALAAVLVVNTVISAFFYFRVIRLMYLEPGDGTGATIAPGLVLLAAGCAVLLVIGFIGFGPLSAAAGQLGDFNAMSAR